MSLPIPKRMLRSRVALLLLILFPLLLLHHVFSAHETSIGVWIPQTGILGVGLLPSRPARRKPKPKPKVVKPARKPAPKQYGAKGAAGDVSLDDLVRHPGYTGEEVDYDSGEDVWSGSDSGSGSSSGSSSSGSSGSSGFAAKIKMDPTVPQHKYLPNGLLVPNPKGQHPIYDLIARSREAWEAKLAKASTTLAEAVDEYRRRYHRAPPKGFDRWWKWAKKHNVQLPDEYDQIHTDLEPFFALTPSQLHALRRSASAMEGMYTIKCGARSMSSRCKYTIQEKGLNDEGKLVAFQRAEAQLELIREIENELEVVEAVFYSHDVPWQFVGYDYKGSLVEAAAVGEYYEPVHGEFDTSYRGWASACAPHKPLREEGVGDTRPDLEKLWNAPKSFVWDHKAVMDPCTNPDLVHLMGFLSSHGKGPGPSFQMFPVMAMCKTLLHSDVLGVSAEAWTEDVGDDPEWDDKPDNRVLWRGKTTGIYFKHSVPWNISQRINLVEHADRVHGTLPVTPLTKLREPVGKPQRQSWADLNSRLMNVAFVDDPIQCDEELCETLMENYYFAERVDWAQGNRYKYLLDVDGNGWSARFKRLMSTNSVVLKSTIFPEWYSDRVQPWVHYIPLKPDLTDLYDVMTFFQTEHDDLAKEIGATGKQWSKTFWRKEDMVAYQFRLLLELARLMAPDREMASYNARGAQAAE